MRIASSERDSPEFANLVQSKAQREQEVRTSLLEVLGCGLTIVRSDRVQGCYESLRLGKQSRVHPLGHVQSRLAECGKDAACRQWSWSRHQDYGAP